MGSRITTHNLDGTISVSDTRTIDDARAEAAQRLEGHFAALIVAGRNYAGHNYQIDDASQYQRGSDHGDGCAGCLVRGFLLDRIGQFACADDGGGGDRVRAQCR